MSIGCDCQLEEERIGKKEKEKQEGEDASDKRDKGRAKWEDKKQVAWKEEANAEKTR